MDEELEHHNALKEVIHQLKMHIQTTRNKASMVAQDVAIPLSGFLRMACNIPKIWNKENELDVRYIFITS